MVFNTQLRVLHSVNHLTISLLKSYMGSVVIHTHKYIRKSSSLPLENIVSINGTNVALKTSYLLLKTASIDYACKRGNSDMNGLWELEQ